MNRASPLAGTLCWVFLLATPLVACAGPKNDAAGGGKVEAPECAAAPDEPARETRYVPAFAPDAGTRPTIPRGTLQGDFQWAAMAPDLPEAIRRWQAFLDRHAPKDGVFEDGAHINHVRGARLELMRAQYLAGNTQDADTLLRAVFDESPAAPSN